MQEELLELTRRLRRRVEQSHRSSWTATAPAVSDVGRVLSSPTPSDARVAAGRKDVRPAGTCGTSDTAGAPSTGALGDATRPGVADKESALQEIAARVAQCRLCPLGKTRIKTVPGVGSPQAEVLFVGEGPGFEEDRRGEPFVGPAGELLDRILASIGLSRQTVFIANMVKCHPMKDPARPEARGNDRPPSPDELAACRPYLERQVRVLAPRIIVALGATAARALLASEAPIGRLRGGWTELRIGELMVKVLPTYHPAALLRNPELKKDVWKDMKALRDALAKG